MKDVLKDEVNVLSANDTIAQARQFIDEPGGKNFHVAFAVINENEEDKLLGVVGVQEIFSSKHTGDEKMSSLIKGHAITVHGEDSLHKAIDKMIAHNVDILPVVSKEDKQHLYFALARCFCNGVAGQNRWRNHCHLIGADAISLKVRAGFPATTA